MDEVTELAAAAIPNPEPLAFIEQPLESNPNITVLRSTRTRRVPIPFGDVLPDRLLSRQLQQYACLHKPAETTASSLPSSPSPSEPVSMEPSTPPRPSTPLTLETEPNSFGLYRVYKDGFPSRDPEDDKVLDDLLDAPTFIQEPSSAPREPADAFGPALLRDTSSQWFKPYANATLFRIFKWFYSGSKKTLQSLNALVHEVILAPDFSVNDIPSNFDAVREAKRLDIPEGEHTDHLDIWRTNSVTIHLPHPSCSCSEDEAPLLQIPVTHRDLLKVIKSAYEDSMAMNYHWKGFQLMWKAEDMPKPIRVYGESYTADTLLELEDDIRVSRPADCPLEAVVAPIMVYTDATKLANFGTASLWPGYLWTGMLSKYERAKPSSFSAHHFVYIPSVSDTQMASSDILYYSLAS
jgi:hypothetical protein